MEYENLLTKEELAQVAVGTMDRWQVYVQYKPDDYEITNPSSFVDIAILIVAGKDADDAIERAFATEHLRDLFLLHDDMRALFKLFDPNKMSTVSSIILNKDMDYYYPDPY